MRREKADRKVVNEAIDDRRLVRAFRRNARRKAKRAINLTIDKAVDFDGSFHYDSKPAQSVGHPLATYEIQRHYTS